jgi:hypothetical protein
VARRDREAERARPRCARRRRTPRRARGIGERLVHPLGPEPTSSTPPMRRASVAPTPTSEADRSPVGLLEASRPSMPLAVEQRLCAPPPRALDAASGGEPLLRGAARHGACVSENCVASTRASEAGFHAAEARSRPEASVRHPWTTPSAAAHRQEARGRRARRLGAACATWAHARQRTWRGQLAQRNRREPGSAPRISPSAPDHGVLRMRTSLRVSPARSHAR